MVPFERKFSRKLSMSSWAGTQMNVSKFARKSLGNRGKTNKAETFFEKGFHLPLNFYVREHHDENCRTIVKNRRNFHNGFSWGKRMVKCRVILLLFSLLRLNWIFSKLWRFSFSCFLFNRTLFILFIRLSTKMVEGNFKRNLQKRKILQRNKFRFNLMKNYLFTTLQDNLM